MSLDDIAWIAALNFVIQLERAQELERQLDVEKIKHSFTKSAVMRAIM